MAQPPPPPPPAAISPNQSPALRNAWLKINEVIQESKARTAARYEVELTRLREENRRLKESSDQVSSNFGSQGPLSLTRWGITLKQRQRIEHLETESQSLQDENQSLKRQLESLVQLTRYPRLTFDRTVTQNQPSSQPIYGQPQYFTGFGGDSEKSGVALNGDDYGNVRVSKFRAHAFIIDGAVNRN